MTMPPTLPDFSPTRWSLADLFPGPDSSELQTAFAELNILTASFETLRAELRPDIDSATLLDIIRKLETLTHKAYRLYGYASLWFAEDTQNQAAQSMQARVQRFLAEMTNRTLFFNLWWKALDDASAERLMAAISDYRYWLEEMRHFKTHTLTEAEEKVINIKDVTGVSALRTLYDAITNRYVFKLEVAGEVRELTREELTAYVQDPDPDLRARAYQELYRVYTADAPILGQIYQTLVRDWRNENVDLRHFANPIAVRNLSNDIPDDVVDTLLSVCEENAPLFRRYFQLKARWLGVDRLRRYDIYAPIAKSDKTYAYNDAVHTTLAAFHSFEPKVADLARSVFTANHVDSETRKGKRSGAFCSTLTPDLIPWVLLNYQGRARDVATTAHELGHAVHSLLASHHSILTFHPSLPLAETASTFAEMLLVDRLLAEEKDEAFRSDLLFKQVDDAYATILRQTFFALFERQAHDMIHAGATVDDLAEAYRQNLYAQFGDAVDIAPEFAWEWVAIPHVFHAPFYVYAYAFGQLLVLALYQQYKTEGDAFKPRYLDILSAGGSAAPAGILAAAGIDIHNRAFWQGGFDILAQLIEELESIPISL